MSHLVRVFVIAGAVGLLCLTAAAGYAALRACALDVAWLSQLDGCPAPAEKERRERLDRLAADRAVLEQRIDRAEARLAARQCTAVLPDPDTPLPDRAWRQGDLETLYGCWSLGSNYRTRDVDTGKIVSYPDWHMCFNARGEGRQVMRGDDGSVCEGPVQARIDNRNRLILGEGGNLSCDDGGYIHRRDIACARGGDAGAVTCETLQPETNGQASVPLTRLR
ncbi:MAG: hypothetical protein RI571_02315 [Roseovarius sp.]|nr:hypothetical protein [Roseovarius sp.]